MESRACVCGTREIARRTLRRCRRSARAGVPTGAPASGKRVITPATCSGTGSCALSMFAFLPVAKAVFPIFCRSFPSHARFNEALGQRRHACGFVRVARPRYVALRVRRRHTVRGVARSLVAVVRPGDVALVPSPYPGSEDAVVLVVGLDTTGRTADVVTLHAVGRSEDSAVLYEREAGAATRFERVDKLAPLKRVQRDETKDVWKVTTAELESVKAAFLSPAGQAAVQAEMEQIESSIDRRIFERSPSPVPTRTQLLTGSGICAGASVACVVALSQHGSDGLASASGVLTAAAFILSIVSGGLALAALRQQQ
jgi:hypothetical protein